MRRKKGGILRNLSCEKRKAAGGGIRAFLQLRMLYITLAREISLRTKKIERKKSKAVQEI